MPTAIETWNELVTFLEKMEPAKVTVEVEEPSDEDEPEPDESLHEDDSD